MSFDLIKSIEQVIKNKPKEKNTIRKILIPFKDEIKNAFSTGYNVKEVYQGFVSNEIITCSYQRFCEVIHSLFPELKYKYDKQRNSTTSKQQNLNVNTKNVQMSESAIHHEIHVQKGAPPEERWHRDSSEQKPYHKHKAIMTDEDRKRLI